MNQDVFPLGAQGMTQAPKRPVLRRAAVASVAAMAMVLGCTPTARADELTDRQKQINSQLAQSRTNVDDFSEELDKAADALQKSRDELTAAQQELEKAQQVRSAAQAEDRRLARELESARKALAAAKKKVADNQRALDKEAALIGASVRETAQQNSELLGLAAFTSLADTTGDVNSRVQWSSTIFNSTQAKMDRLSALQLKLQDAQTAADAAEKDVEDKKQAAADQVVATQAAEEAADRAQQSVGTLVAQNKAATAAAASKLDAEKKRQASLDAEGKAVAERIAARIAAQKAEAARKAAIAKAKAEAEARARAAAEKARKEAAAKARAEAEAARKAAAAAKAKRAADAAAKQAAADRAEARAAAAEATAKKASSTTSTSSSKASSSSSYSASSYFDYPVNGPVTSVYGMRFHPVLHVWKLHDGTDFGAECGAPLRAPRDGVVTEEYYNAGYGNRLMIDHGKVGGHYVTTGFNHATHYVVNVGDHVSRGQIVGYVGSTGYSTGCHLHLMVWEDGDVVNPMNWF